MGEHLFALETERWRPMRAKLSPIFTSGKLKEMFPLIIECSKNMEPYLDKIAERGKYIECRDLAAKFTTDVIGSCAFGIDMNSISDKDSEFRIIGRKLFTPTFKTIVRDVCRQFLPGLYDVIGHKLQIEEVNEFLTNLIKDTINYRKENKIVRPDFVNTLIELKDHPEKLETISMSFKINFFFFSLKKIINVISMSFFFLQSWQIRWLLRKLLSFLLLVSKLLHPRYLMPFTSWRRIRKSKTSFARKSEKFMKNTENWRTMWLKIWNIWTRFSKVNKNYVKLDSFY